MGVSGGEEGARNGPSLMFGGSNEAYALLEPILSKSAAQVKAALLIRLGNRSDTVLDIPHVPSFLNAFFCCSSLSSLLLFLFI